jgi:hypothetical protein
MSIGADWSSGSLTPPQQSEYFARCQIRGVIVHTGGLKLHSATPSAKSTAMSAEDDEKKKQGEMILQYFRKKYPYPREASELTDHGGTPQTEPINDRKDRAEPRRRARSPQLWWSAAVAALCAAGGSLL